MKRLIIFSFIMMFSLSLMAQKRYDEIKYPELNEREMPEIEEFSLDNGIRFYLVEDHELPLINLRVLVRTGSVLIPEDKTGMAGMTGQVMRSGGSESYPSDTLNELLENNAVNLSISIGFGSGSASLNTLKEDFDEILPVFLDVLRNPSFPQDKIDLAKTQNKSAISRRNDNQQGIGYREFEKLIYGENSVYTRQEEYSTIDNITREDLVNFHKDHFVGNNMMVGIVGDFDSDEMKRKLEMAFGSIPAGKETTLVYPEIEYDYPVSINYVDKADVNQSFITLGHIGGLRDNPDYAALQVMNEVLSGGFSGRLFQKIRTDMGLAYSVGGSYDSNINFKGIFRITTMTKSATTAEAIDAIIAEIERMKTDPPTEEELQETKDQFLNSLVFRSVSKAQILSQRLNNVYNGMDPDAFDKLVEEIKEVTPQDVQRVAREYLNPDQVQILVVGNMDEIGDQLQKYGEVNEIDITIPKPTAKKEEAAEAGDAEQGKKWLTNMAEAVIEPGTEFSTIVATGSQTIVTPMGEMNISGTTTTNFKTGYQKALMNTPRGEVEMVIEDGKGSQSMGGQEFPMPPAQVEMVEQELQRNYLHVALNRSSVDAEYLGMENIDGTEYVKIRFKFDDPVTYFIDQDTHLPAVLRYDRFNPQTGANQEMESRFSEWKTVNGITYAFTIETYADGEKAATQQTESIEVNKE